MENKRLPDYVSMGGGRPFLYPGKGSSLYAIRFYCMALAVYLSIGKIRPTNTATVIFKIYLKKCDQ